LKTARSPSSTRCLDEIITKKREIFRWYSERLSGIPGILLNNPGHGVHGTYWMVSIVWEDRFGVSKKDVRDALAVHGMDTRPFFSPLSSLGAYQNLPGIEDYRQKNPVSYRLRDSGINLPSSLSLEENQVELICSVVRKIFSAE
jgi:perosamine synthetase